MAALAFVWDASTARSNAKKHGVSLDEAQSAFSDERARIIDDPDHSGDDDRFIFLGMSSKPRVLVVVYAYRDREATIAYSRELAAETGIGYQTLIHSYLKAQASGNATGSDIRLVQVMSRTSER